MISPGYGSLDRVGLEINTTNTRSMVFLPGRIRTCLSEELYLSRVDTLHMGSRKSGKVECHICKKMWKKGLLQSHLAMQHVVYHSTCSPGRR